jgi:CheY-like chemotaxis protein
MEQVEFNFDTDIEKYRLTALIAEDNLFNSKLLVTLLNRIQWDCIECTNGAEAIEIYKNTRIDIALLDIQMPDINGFDAAREIRKIQAQTGKTVPILAITALALKEDRDQGMEAGMDEYLVKPIDQIVFYDILQKNCIKYDNRTDLPVTFEDVLERYNYDYGMIKQVADNSVVAFYKFFKDTETLLKSKNYDTLNFHISQILENIKSLDLAKAYKFAMLYEYYYKQKDIPNLPLIYHRLKYQLYRFIDYYQNTMIKNLDK